jgi:hypothetical protein
MDFYVRGTSVVRCDWRADAARVFMGGADQAALEVCAAALGIDLPQPWPDDVF